MADTPQKIIGDIKSGKFAPIYLLEGEEAFYIDLVTDTILQHALSESEREFNQTVIYGKDANVISVLNHARRFPMMAERQVVVVKEAQQLSDINREGGRNQLEQYCNSPVPSTVLVFCYKNKTLDKRQKVTKAMASVGVIMTTKKMYENQVPGWINGYVESKGATITPKANQLLTQYIGNNLERLSNEIDKMLINFKGGKGEINDSLVQQFVGINKEYNVFELQNALLQKDKDKVFKMIKFFNANPKSTPPLIIPAQLYGMFSKLLLASENPGSNPKELASVLRVNPFFVKDYITGLNNYSLNQIAASFNYLKEADGKLKGVDSGSVDSGAIISELIYKLMK